MAETPEYNPKEAFDAQLEENQAEAVKMLDTTLTDKMAWALRASNEYGQAAESRLKAVLGAKAEQATQEIRRIRDSQLEDFGDAERTMLVNVQNAVFTSIQQRAFLLLDMAAMDKTKADGQEVVSSMPELVKLKEISSMIEMIDVQSLVYSKLPPERQERYLESVGRSFRPDFHDLLERNNDGKDLLEADWALLLTEIQKLGTNPNSIEQSSVIMTLGLLSPANRTELVRKMSEEESFPNFEAVLTSMVGSGYITVLAATEVLDAKIASLEGNRKAKKELESLQATRARINGEGMKRTQTEVAELRVKAAKHYSTRSFGHKNRARELLTVKGIGSALLTVNGMMTVMANVAMGLADPLDIPLNPALWIGVAQVGAGLEMSGGHGGLVSTPKKLAAKLITDKDEEKDDKMEAYEEAFKTGLNNYHREAHFYANYAERITTVYKAKKAKNPDQPAAITLKDIGVTKKEDLPEQFQDLWEKKDLLEAKMTEWVAQFSRTSSADAMRAPEASGQRDFIEAARKEVGAKDMTYAELPPFDYKAE